MERGIPDMETIPLVRNISAAAVMSIAGGAALGAALAGLYRMLAYLVGG
jgi:hypothetical protein